MKNLKFALTGKLRNGASCDLPPRHLMVARIKELLGKPALTEKEREDLEILRQAIGEHVERQDDTMYGDDVKQYSPKPSEG